MPDCSKLRRSRSHAPLALAERTPLTTMARWPYRRATVPTCSTRFTPKCISPGTRKTLAEDIGILLTNRARTVYGHKGPSQLTLGVTDLFATRLGAASAHFIHQLLHICPRPSRPTKRAVRMAVLSTGVADDG